MTSYRRAQLFVGVGGIDGLDNILLELPYYILKRVRRVDIWEVIVCQ